MNKWPEHRIKELQSFHELLREVTMINHGTHCLERVARCIDLAEKLRDLDLKTDPVIAPFADFLVEIAHGKDPS